ncbi:VTC domain protein [Streptococcus oralis]|nr:VTC domain protein [Streptococcus oralis]
MKPLETSFERIETKYLVSKTDLQDLIEDLKDYLVEDDYPTSTISNIYFDTEDFQLIQDSLQDQHKKEKIRMRTYLAQPSADSPAFLEIKSKDEAGVGHKHRVLSQSDTITQLITKGWGGNLIKDSFLVAEVQKLRQRYSEALKPRIYISYDRFSLKEKRKYKDSPTRKFVSLLTKI